MCDTKFSLCPRGFGRTSYRLAETILAGRIPVFEYSDQLWVPYRDLFNRIGFAADAPGLPPLLIRLGECPLAGKVERDRALRLAVECIHMLGPTLVVPH
jgi:hypothetical protein